MKLSNAIDGFVLARSSILSPRTIEDYQFYLQLWLKRSTDIQLEDVTTKDLQRFLAWLSNDYTTRHGKPLGQSGKRHGWVAIRAFWTWVSEDLDLQNVSVGIQGPSLPNTTVIPFTRKDVESLLRGMKHSNWIQSDKRKTFRYARAESVRDRALLLVLLDTGLRVGELCRLTVEDVDLKNHKIQVRAHRSGTKSRPRVIPLTGRTCSAVWRYITAREESNEVFTRDTPLFISSRGPRGSGGKLSRMAIYHLLRRLGDRVGVQDVHPHRFRHTFAIEYLRGGGNPWMLQHMLGHSTMAMVQRYLHFVGEDFQKVHQRASAVERWRL